MTTAALYSTIAAFMDEAEWPYQGEAESGILSAEINGDEGSWRVYIQITDDDEARRVVVHAQLPARIPDGNRVKVAELLTRINYDLIVGNFELGLDDGEVLFKTTLDLADGQLTQAMFERMYVLNGQTMNQYFSQILSVGYGGGKQANDAAEDRPHGLMLQ